MISVIKLTKKFANKIVLQDISFEAKKGEIIGFLGLNGVGKTTTMRLMLGYLLPTSGTIEINGLTPKKDRLKLLSKIGYLPENNPLYPEMKVAEYLDFIASLKHENNKESIMSSVGLDEVEDTKIEELSRGYKQRVGLAAALCGNPEILILDEPTSGLDPIEQEKIRILIKKISSKKTIIFSTHILSEIEEIVDKLVIIHKGTVVFDGEKPKKKGAVETLFKRLVKE